MKIHMLLSRPGPAGSPFKQISESLLGELTVYYCSNLDPFGHKVDNMQSNMQGYGYVFLRDHLSVITKFFNNNPDVLVVHGWDMAIFWIVYTSAFLKRIPVLIISESSHNQELLKDALKQKIKKIILGWLFKRVGGFLYIGEENKNFYKSFGIEDQKLFFYPYAVDNHHLSEIASSIDTRYKLRKQLEIREEDIVILFIGRLIKKKRPMDLLKAFENIPDLAHLVFVGDGPERVELENYARYKELNNVKFIGFKNSEEILSYYAMSDIFVLPSGLGETWGFVVNEAMNFSLPIITSDMVGSARDLVRVGENGFIFSCGDISQLAKYLKELIEDGDKRRIFGKRSNEIINEYSYEKGVDGLKEALMYLGKI